MLYYVYSLHLFIQVISLRIASRFGGEAQEIVLHSGTTQGGGAKSQGDAINNTATADTNPSTVLPGPSNATTSALRNVAQIIAAGKLLLHTRGRAQINVK